MNIADLIASYRTDQASAYRNLRHQTKGHYQLTLEGRLKESGPQVHHRAHRTRRG